MADPDEASSALIAQLLQQDSAYSLALQADGMYDGFDPSDDEEEYIERKRKRKKSKGGSRPAAKRATTAIEAPKAKDKADDQSETNETTTNGKARKRAPPRRWTDEEEMLFLEALELYGRDWRKCSDHLKGSRGPRDVASHAQKHFIRLYKDDKPLPDKVRESGEGYTLSGKPLDPDSAAARAYGLRGTEGSKEYREQKALERQWRAEGKDVQIEKPIDPKETNLEQVTEETDTQEKEKEKENSSENKEEAQMSARARNDMLLAKAKAEGLNLGQRVSTDPVPVRAGETAEEREERVRKKREKLAQEQLEREVKREEVRREKEKEKAEKWAAKQAEVEKLYDENGQTEYSRNRSRRRVTTRFVAEPTSELQFVPCSRYHGIPGSGELRCQPFRVEVHSSVYALVDFHSHMSSAEVIGFLAGTWDPAKRMITVNAAFPGRSMTDGDLECEMDPVVEVSLRAEIEGLGLSVVGWYHSHPTFEPVPSSCDVDNQCNYQALFRDARSGTEPFIALIDSPFDMRLPSPHSKFNWFYVESPRVNKTPMRVDTELIPDETLSAETMDRMVQIAKQKNELTGKATNFDEIWKELPGIGPCSFKKKLIESMSLWFPPLVYVAKRKEKLGLDLGGLEKQSDIERAAAIVVAQSSSPTDETKPDEPNGKEYEPVEKILEPLLKELAT